MLSDDEARRRLAEFQVDPWEKPLHGRIGLLRIGTHARTLLSQLPWSEEQPSEAEIAALLGHLESLDDRRLVRLFGHVAPRLGDELARHWRWAAGTPYQSDWLRRPFRSREPEDSAPARLATTVQLLTISTSFREPFGFLTAWAPHVNDYYGSLGSLCASEISRGDTGLVGHLIDHAEGRVETGGMGTHVVAGLLGGDDPEGWEYVAGLLERAERQEGLRQSILEHADFGHPDAFARVLDVVVDHDLTRFAATVRAAGVWFGEELEVRQGPQIAGHLDAVRRHLRQPPTALADLPADGPGSYLALWAVAYRDVDAALVLGTEVLAHGSADARVAAARLLAETRLRRARDLLTPALADDEDRVVAAALEAWPALGWHEHAEQDLRADQVTALLEVLDRTGRGGKQQIGMLGTRTVPLTAARVADALVGHAPQRTDAELERIDPAYQRASADGRRIRIQRLVKDPVRNRTALLAAVGDAGQHNRSEAARALADLEELSPIEAERLEALFTRKASDLRRHVLGLLLKQPPDEIRASATRLADGTAPQQRAAEELLAAAGLRHTEEEPVSLAERCGLDHARRTPAPRPPHPTDLPDLTADLTRVITSLHAWLDEHRDVEVTVHWSDGRAEQELVGNLRHLGQPLPEGGHPLDFLIDPWWERTRPGLAGGGLELWLLCALANPSRTFTGWLAPVLGSVPERFTDWRSSGVAPAVVAEVVRRLDGRDWDDPLLAVLQELVATLPLEECGAPGARSRQPRDRWAHHHVDARDVLGSFHQRFDPLFVDGTLDAGQQQRYWALLRHLDEPLGRHDPAVDPMRPSPALAERYGVPETSPRALEPVRCPRVLPAIEVVLTAHERGLATRDDVVDWVLQDSRRWQTRHGLHMVTSRQPPPWLLAAPRAAAVVGEVLDEALAVERERGEFGTEATHVVRRMRQCVGTDVMLGHLRALGDRPFPRGYSWTDSRESSLGEIIRKCRPADDETAEGFATAAADIPAKRLIEVGVYAPQWAALVEATVDWPGLEDTVWWLHAHTKGEDWSVDTELREEWTAQVARRTPLDAEELTRGAVDVAWFHDCLATLGEERFDDLLKAAKYASSAGGHKRAQLYADALRGRIAADDLLDRISAKRHQDSVRALGLVPFGAGSRGDEDLATRYRLLREFVASDRGSGSQRRASETAAVEVGMENLARTAGYADPQRLVWAVEARAVADLAEGPLTATHDDLVVSLSLVDGAPELDVRRGERRLKSVPKASAKVPEIAALRERVTELRKQTSRMRRSLEEACVHGEAFTPDELEGLWRHPLLVPMLTELVGVTDEGHAAFLTDLRDTASGTIRIAHPHDLLASGEWPDLQHVLFSGRRTQPFKQLFRELYVPTDAERAEGNRSARYAGHQVQPGRAAGLFRSRGWVADFEVGFTRTWHRERLTAFVSLLQGWGSPTEVEDATVEHVHFVARGREGALPLDEVPPRIFSETMRDLDLVVSVAHSGGVDPETSQSSVEMRARLVEETGDLLGLTNVEVTGHHALVQGTLGSYSVNLGSGVVHRLPGNAVCIVPVHAQHRGRVFLPFADDDPRTAEVISKVVLLARDERIKDPTILAQLRG